MTHLWFALAHTVEAGKLGHDQSPTLNTIIWPIRSHYGVATSEHSLLGTSVYRDVLDCLRVAHRACGFFLASSLRML